MNTKKSSMPLTKQFLNILAKGSFKVIDTYIKLLPWNINRYAYGDTGWEDMKGEELSRWKTKQLLRQLKQRKYIEMKTKGNEILYRLTKKGITEVMLSKIKRQSKLLPKDNFCIICFDIPVAVNDLRWALRRFLKMAGFERLQKSVWYTNRDICDLANIYIKNIKAEDWVKVISASKIS